MKQLLVQTENLVSNKQMYMKKENLQHADSESDIAQENELQHELQENTPSSPNSSSD